MRSRQSLWAYGLSLAVIAAVAVVIAKANRDAVRTSRDAAGRMPQMRRPRSRPATASNVELRKWNGSFETGPRTARRLSHWPMRDASGTCHGQRGPGVPGRRRVEARPEGRSGRLRCARRMLRRGICRSIDFATPFAKRIAHWPAPTDDWNYGVLGTVTSSWATMSRRGRRFNE